MIFITIFTKKKPKKKGGKAQETYEHCCTPCSHRKKKRTHKKGTPRQNLEDPATKTSPIYIDIHILIIQYKKQTNGHGLRMGCGDRRGARGREKRHH